jgi:hypothetical protein
MEFDDQLRRYFGTADLATTPPAALEAGIERMLVDLGLEQNSGRRFALWALLYTLGRSPDLDVTFKRPDERDAARDLMDMLDRGPTADGLGDEFT